MGAAGVISYGPDSGGDYMITFDDDGKKTGYVKRNVFTLEDEAVLAAHWERLKAVVSALLAACPAAAGEKSMKDGKTALHYAAENKAPPEVVSALLAACPKAAGEKSTKEGKTPLHYAAEKKAPPEVVSALLAACPAAAQQKDNEARFLCTVSFVSPRWSRRAIAFASCSRPARRRGTPRAPPVSSRTGPTATGTTRSRLTTTENKAGT